MGFNYTLIIANEPVKRRREIGEAAEHRAMQGIVSIHKTSQASLAKCNVTVTMHVDWLASFIDSISNYQSRDLTIGQQAN